MRHAGPATLDGLEPLLRQLRLLPGLKERSRGVFYRGSKPFLHFHEDPSGTYADLRDAAGDFDRIRLDDAASTALPAEVAARLRPS